MSLGELPDIDSIGMNQTALDALLNYARKAIRERLFEEAYSAMIEAELVQASLVDHEVDGNRIENNKKSIEKIYLSIEKFEAKFGDKLGISDNIPRFTTQEYCR